MLENEPDMKMFLMKQIIHHPTLYSSLFLSKLDLDVALNRKKAYISGNKDNENKENTKSQCILMMFFHCSEWAE